MGFKSFAVKQAANFAKNKLRDKRNYATYLKMKAMDAKKSRPVVAQDDDPLQETMKSKGIGKYYHRPKSKIQAKLRGHLQAQAASDRGKDEPKANPKQIKDFMKSHVARIKKLRGNKV